MHNGTDREHRSRCCRQTVVRVSGTSIGEYCRKTGWYVQDLERLAAKQRVSGHLGCRCRLCTRSQKMARQTAVQVNSGLGERWAWTQSFGPKRMQRRTNFHMSSRAAPGVPGLIRG